MSKLFALVALCATALSANELSYKSLQSGFTGWTTPIFDHGILTFSVAGLAVHPFVLAIGVQQFMTHVLGAPRGMYCPLTTHDVPRQIIAVPEVGGRHHRYERHAA